MNKKVLLIFILAVLSQFIVSVSASESAPTPWHTDDFSEYEVGTDYIESGAYKSGSTTGFVTIQNDGDGNYLLFDGTLLTSAPGYTGYQFPTSSHATDNVTTIKFDYKIMGEEQGIHFYSGKTINMELDATPRGYSDIIDDGTYYINSPISTGVWHEITAIINLEKQSFDLYVDDIRVLGKGNFREADQTTISRPFLYINNSSDYAVKKFGLRNIRAYSGEVLPEFSNEYAKALSSMPEKQLVSLAEHTSNLTTYLSSAYAVFDGYPIAFSGGIYELVSDNKSLAPVLYDGYVFAPAGYVAKALGGSYSDQIITVGEKTYEFNEGVTSELCEKPPIKVEDELYIPITNTLAEYFGSCAYVDERGLAIIGMSEKPEESVIKSLLFELRNRSAVFGSGIKSDVLFTNRSTFYLDRPDVKGGYASLDAAKRFMSTSTVWTFNENISDIQKFIDLGSFVQATLNARPVTVDKDSDGNDIYYTANGKKYLQYTASSIAFDGNIRLRDSDGLDGWGCVNNDVFFTDLLGKVKSGIDRGQYIWQFDDHALNSGYGCYCDDCLTAFTTWLQTEKGFTTYKDLADNYGAGDTAWKWTEVSYSTSEWLYENLGIGTKTETVCYDETICATAISEFNYKTYLTETEGFTTNAEANTYYTNKTRMGKAYFEFSRDKVKEFHKKLRDDMEAYAEEKGLHIYISHNTSNASNSIKDSAWLYDIMDASMAEINPKYTQPCHIFALKLSEQAFDSPFISSLWVNQGKTSMQLWESVVPLMCATGQRTIIPWDSWVYNSTRYNCTPEELANNYSFIREYPYLFDHYEAPEEIGYILDMDDGEGLTVYNLRDIALGLGKKGIASRFIAKRSTQTPYYSVDASDLEGLKAIVNVNEVALTDAENEILTTAGLTPNAYTFDADTVTTLQTWETDFWTARIKNMPENTFAVLRKNSLYENAPVVVHVVSFESFVQNNVEVEINNSYLPSDDNFTVKIYSPGNNPYTKQISKSADGITTLTIDTLDNWAVLEICGEDNKSAAKFNVTGMSGIGIGSRVSYDSAQGTEDDFTITTYGEGIINNMF